MKRIFTILLVLITLASFGQTPVNAPVFQRATAGNTVQDSRLMAQYNLFVPRYLDTTAASVQSNIVIDSCGAIIFTYDVNNFWVRACNPKRWERVSGVQALADGVYAGGDVGYTGNNLDFFETAATFVLNGVLYNTPTVNPITLDPSDPTFSRIDLIGLGPTGPTFITGTPAASPQEPSYNPQVFIRRAAVLVEAGALTPTITTDIIYDENLGTPTEWAGTNTGGTVNFASTLFPYHLTIAAHVTVFDSSNRLKFNFTDTVNSSPRGSIVGFIRLATTMPANQNLFIQLFYQGVAVSLQLPFTGFGMFRNITAQYQPIIFPMPSFGSNNIIFDEIRIVPTGSGAFPVMDLDYIQFQTGFSPIVTRRDFGVEDNFAYSPRAFDFNNTNFYWNNINKYISTVSPTSDSAFTIRKTNGLDLFRIDATGNTANMYTMIVGAAGSPTFIVSPSFARVVPPFPLQFDGGSYINAYQYPLFIRKSYPVINSNTQLNAALILDNDTISANGVDSSLYHPLVVRFTSTVTNVSTEKLSIDGRGAVRSFFLPHTATADTFMVRKNGYYQGVTTAEALSILGASSGAISNVGGGYRWVIPNTNTVKTIFTTNGIFADSATNSNALTLQVDSLNYTTRGRSQKMADSVTALIGAAGTNANIGTGFRLAVFGTRNIKSIIAGANISIDSSVSGSLTIASSAGSPGTLTSFGFTNLNGFSGSVANSTTTPTLTLSTSVTSGQALYSNGTALSGSANYTWDNTNQRLNIGGGSAVAYLGLAPSTTTQASLNLGNAGTAPTSPANADLWVASNHILARLGGTTYQIDQQPLTMTINSTAITSGTSGRILFQNSSNQVSQNANLFWDNTNNRLQLNGATVAAALALPLSTTTQAPLNLGNAGTAPTSPNNADVWVASNHIFVRLNGVTTQLDAQTSAGVTSAIGTANQVNVSAATGAVTFSLPQSIATTSVVQFGRLTLGGTAATSPLTFVTNTDATASAGRWYYNTTRLGFAPAGVIKRVALTNDVAPANGQIPIGNGTDYTVAAISPSDNATLVTNGAGSISIGPNKTFQTLTDGATITWNAANGFNARVTLGATGRTLSRSNWVNGQTYTIIIIQDATGSRTITTWPSGTIWPSGSAPVLPTAANSKTIVSFIFDGTNCYGAYTNAAYQ